MGNYLRIPAEMQEQNCWVCGKADNKIPWQAARRKAASSTDPSTWATFQEAEAALWTVGYDYLGYVFRPNGIIGIDIDIGYEDGLLSAMAYDIIVHCRSYTEYSKSGRGFHIFIKGNLPFKGKNNRKGVEIYREGRFFICTGKPVMFYNLRENQAGIDYVIEKYFDSDISEKEKPSGKRKTFIKGETIYLPEYDYGPNGLIINYPPIGEGSRNISLLSYGGQLINQGLSSADILTELQRVNSIACQPPLSDEEVENIYKSVMRYYI